MVLESEVLVLVLVFDTQVLVLVLGEKSLFTSLLTRNSPVDGIGERYRLNHAVVVKLQDSQFSSRPYHWKHATFSAHRDFFIVAPFVFTYLVRNYLLIISMAVLKITHTN